MNNLYLNRWKIQPQKDNNICKEYNDVSLFIYILTYVSVCVKRVSWNNEKTLRRGKQKPTRRETKKLLLFNQHSYAKKSVLYFVQ